MIPPKDYKGGYAWVREKFPLSCSLLEPRRYRIPDAAAPLYHPASMGLLLDIMSICDQAHNEKEPEFEEFSEDYRGFLCLQRLRVECGCPTYFLAPDIGEALLDTEPPADQPVEEIRWPYPAFRLILPKEWLTLYGIQLAAVDIALLTPGPLHPHRAIQEEIRRNTVSHPRIFGEDDTVDAPALACSFSYLTARQRSFITPWKGTVGEMLSAFRRGDADGDLADEVIHLTRLVTNILMILSMVPDEVSDERQERPEKRDRKGGVVRDALWVPHFIGRPAYRAPKQGEAVPNGNRFFNQIRKGHWKRQPYGPRHSLRRSQWIHFYRTKSMEVRGIKPENS